MLRATSTGLSTVFVIASAAALSDRRVARLVVDIDGARLTTRDGGSEVLAGESDGSLMMAPPTWWDAKSGGSPAGPGNLGVPRPLDAELSDSKLTLDVAGAAAQPDVRYPLYVDPSWVGGVQAWTFTDSAYPAQSYWLSGGSSDGFQHVGYINGGNSDDGQDHTTRSYWQMDTSVLAGAHIASAYFNTTLAYSFSCSPRVVNLYSSMDVGPATTWNSNPGWVAYQDGQSAAAGYNGACPIANVGFNTMQATTWAASVGAPHMTFAMAAGDEGDVFGWKKLTGTASLDVRFTKAPTVPQVGSMSCNRYNGLTVGDVLRSGDMRWSQNGRPVLAMVPDGNLAIFKADGAPGDGSQTHPIWSSNTAPNWGAYTRMYPDGNVVIHSAAGAAVWATGVSGQWLVMQDNGDLVEMFVDGAAMWTSGTPDPAFPGAPAAVCYTNSQAPSIRAFGHDVNGGYPVSYRFAFFDASNLLWISPLTAGSTVTSSEVTIPFGLGEGTYSYMAQSCVTDPDDGFEMCSDYSSLRAFIIDRTAPAAPVVTPIAGDASMSASTFFGTVGRSTSSVRMSAGNPATDNIAGYVYQVLPTAADGTLTQVPAGVFPSNPHCGTNMTGYSVVCLNTADQTLDATVAALDERSQISVMAFDMAGNATAAAGVNTVQMNAKPDVAAIKAGHSWTTDAGGSGTCPQGSFADNAPSGGKSLTLSGSACRAQAKGGLPIEPGDSVSALRFDGSAGVAATSGPAIDTSQSFSVGAWLNTAVSFSAGQYMSALAQDGANGSAFFLQYAEGYWRFCTQPVDTGWSAAGTCLDSVNKAAVGEWTFVVGVWDAVNHQIRLYVSSDGATYTPTVAGVDQVMPSGGPFLVGRDMDHGNYRYWNGQVSGPFAVQGVISTSTYEYLGQMRMPTNAMPDIP